MTGKFPLGIEFLDNQIGGIDPGLIILYESTGAGGREFAITSMLNNSEKFPTHYLAISKPPEVVEKEIQLTVPERKERSKINIVSFADLYFKDTLIPIRWVTSDITPDLLKGERNVMSEMVNTFESIESGSYVFLDSLTDLARIAHARWKDLVDLLKGLRILCTKRDILTMALLNAKVLDTSREEELLDQADGIIVFEWVMERDSITRWMYFRKFLGVLPQIEKEKILKYNVMIDPGLGFTISRVMRIL